MSNDIPADAWISNGTCYSAPGEEMSQRFIPCGNAKYGQFTCCSVGDTCLFFGACFGYYGNGKNSAMTYQAGCTDPEYKDRACPAKFFDAPPWVGLTLCDPQDDGIWAQCEQDGSPSTLKAGSDCTCTTTDASTVASTILQNPISRSLRLPGGVGESMVFLDGHTPTGQFSPTSEPTTTGTGSTKPTETGSTSPTAIGSVTNSPSPSKTGSPSPGGGGDPAAESGGMSSGTKIGVGVGATVGGLILIAALIALFILRRRKASSGNNHVDSPSATENGGTGIVAATDNKPPMEQPSAAPAYYPMNSPGPSEADGHPISEIDGHASVPSKIRSELDASPPPMGAQNQQMGSPGLGSGPGAFGYGGDYGGRESVISELPGSPVSQGPSGAYPSPIPDEQGFVPYRPNATNRMP